MYNRNNFMEHKIITNNELAAKIHYFDLCGTFYVKEVNYIS